MSIKGILILLAAIQCALPGAQAAQGNLKVIAIDPGHGGVGTEGHSGSRAAQNLSGVNHARARPPYRHILEKDLTWELSQRVAAVIAQRAKAGAPVKCVLTREQSNQNPNFTQRMAVAGNAGADMVVSIHFNSPDDPASRTTGPVVIYSDGKRNPFANRRDKSRTRALAEAVQRATKRFDPATGLNSFTDKFIEKKGKPNGYYLFYQASINPRLKGVPVYYLEVDFLDSVLAKRVKTLFVDRRKEVMEAWAQAIADELIRQVTKG